MNVVEMPSRLPDWEHEEDLRDQALFVLTQIRAQTPSDRRRVLTLALEVLETFLTHPGRSNALRGASDMGLDACSEGRRQCPHFAAIDKIKINTG